MVNEKGAIIMKDRDKQFIQGLEAKYDDFFCYYGTVTRKFRCV